MKKKMVMRSLSLLKQRSLVSQLRKARRDPEMENQRNLQRMIKRKLRMTNLTKSKRKTNLKRSLRISWLIKGRRKTKLAKVRMIKMMERHK